MTVSNAQVPTASRFASERSRTSRGLVPLYTVAVFLNAALLFSVEPMFAKLVLPLLGGTPSVWNTSLVFFQAALLIGYAYAHVTTRLLSARHQLLVHLLVLSASCLSLPLQLRLHGDPPSGSAGIAWLVLALAMSLGLPFTVLATGAPLLQRWFASSNHPDAANPYFLYAASNLGSLCALLSYPFLVEPWLRVDTQRGVWSVAYVGVMVLVAACALVAQRRPDAAHVSVETANVGMRHHHRATTTDRARWVLYAAVPSSLLMGSTTYVSTDVAAVPLLWVIPLALYLLSFVVAFSARPLLRHTFVLRVQPHMLILAAILFFVGGALPGLLPVAFHFVLLFVVALACHGALAARKPDVALLTEFFLWISVGGLIGGVFNALVAPLLFTEVIEYPIMLSIAALLVGRRAAQGEASAAASARWGARDRVLDLLLPAALAGLLLLALAQADVSSLRSPVAVIGVTLLSVSLLAFSARPLRFGLALAGVMLVGRARSGVAQGVTLLHAERSFFGVYRVQESSRDSTHRLVHGTTLHGSQSTNPRQALAPRTYYHRDGPMGDLFTRTAAATRPDRRVAVVGLGTGSLACYGRHGDRYTYFEIDPAVVHIARNPQLFTFLRDCPPATDIVVGDARLTLRDAPAAAYNVLVLDAFSSDAIPVHLLTREAFVGYERVLAVQGILAVHISNRHLDLEPIVAALARETGFIARIRRDTAVSTAEQATGRSATIWILLARQEADLDPLQTDPRWEPLRAAGEVWTDDFSNVLRVLKWR